MVEGGGQASGSRQGFVSRKKAVMERNPAAGSFSFVTGIALETGNQGLSLTGRSKGEGQVCGG